MACRIMQKGGMYSTSTPNTHGLAARYPVIEAVYYVPDNPAKGTA
jgi:hypothetical protein